MNATDTRAIQSIRDDLVELLSHTPVDERVYIGTDSREVGGYHRKALEYLIDGLSALLENDTESEVTE